MKFIPNAVTSFTARKILLSEKNSPALLFGAGIVGMLASTVMACRATLRVEEVLDQAETDLGKVELARGMVGYSEMDIRKDKTVIYIRAAVGLGRLYGPAILCAVASTAMLAKSHNILNKRNAALAAAYTVLDKSFKDYRARVTDELGEEREREIYRDVREVEIVDKDGKKVKQKSVHGSSMYARLFGRDTSRSWDKQPEYNIVFLRAQQNYLNDRLKARGHLFLNEVYDALGLERSQPGAVVGWLSDSKNGDGYVDFGVFDGGAVSDRFYDFVTGHENSIWLDFNVDGVIYDKI